jgi:hypothetical protein
MAQTVLKLKDALKGPQCGDCTVSIIRNLKGVEYKVLRERGLDPAILHGALQKLQTDGALP